MPYFWIGATLNLITFVFLCIIYEYFFSVLKSQTSLEKIFRVFYREGRCEISSQLIYVFPFFSILMY